MIRRVDLRNIDKIPQPVVPRAQIDVESVISVVKPIIEDVKKNGDEAVINWTEKFDGVKPSAIRVPQEVIDKAFSEMPSDVVDALEEAIKRTKKVHQSQTRNGSLQVELKQLQCLPTALKLANQ